MNSQDFVQLAAKQYQSLAQETSELYKRHYTALPEQLNLEQNHHTEHPNLPIKFDVVVSQNNVSSSSNNVKVLDISEIDQDIISKMLHKSTEDKYVAFVHAHMQKIVVIEAPPKIRTEIKILFNGAMPMLLMINAAQASSADIFEYHISDHSVADTASALIHEVNLAHDAHVELNAVHNQSKNSAVMGFCKNASAQHSTFNLNTVYLGGSHVRVRNIINADSQHAAVHVNEAVLGSDAQRFDIYTKMTNSSAETNATLRSKAALMDTSSCMLKGFAKITAGSKNARSYVHQAVLLLDKGAKGLALPDMSIDESDVKATHAAVAGPVDNEQLFYMESRGIERHKAKHIITAAFLGQAVSALSNPVARELAMAAIADRLQNLSIGKTPMMSTMGLWGANVQDQLDHHYKYRGT